MANITIPQSYEQPIDRAMHNLYCERRSTLHPMTAVPIYFRRMFRGDKFDFSIAEAVLQSQPTFAPLMANWNLRFEWYFDSDANRYSWIDNNTRLSSEEVMNRKHHTFNFFEPLFTELDYEFNIETQTWKNLSVARGSLAEYAGFAPGFVPVVSAESATDEETAVEFTSTAQGYRYNLDFFLTYLNIIRNYHYNRQFNSVPYIRGFAIPGVEGVVQHTDVFGTMSVDLMDDIIMFFRSCPNGCHIDLSTFTDMDDESIPEGKYSDIPDWLVRRYYTAIEAFREWMSCYINVCGGLFCTQFQPDLYQNLLAQDQGLLRSMVTVENGQIAMDTFRLRNHLQILYDEIFVAGGKDRDLSRTRWGIKSNRQYDIPELICVRQEIIGTNLITSNNAGTTDGEIQSVPGDMAGNINTRRNGGRSQRFTATTAGNLMCIVSLTPIVDYCQNNERYLYENHFEDEFSPQMARKGFENVPVTDYCVLPACYADGTRFYPIFVDPNTSVGKQVAWLREMTATNRVFGEFSNGGTQSDWVLTRKFAYPQDSDHLDEVSFAIDEFSPYGNPLAFQYPFVSQTIADPNFYLQVAFNVKALRPIGRRFMPTLGI